jgi:hypothetical protein
MALFVRLPRGSAQIHIETAVLAPMLRRNWVYVVGQLGGYLFAESTPPTKPESKV